VFIICQGMQRYADLKGRESIEQNILANMHPFLAFPRENQLCRSYWK